MEGSVAENAVVFVCVTCNQSSSRVGQLKPTVCDTCRAASALSLKLRNRPLKRPKLIEPSPGIRRCIDCGEDKPHSEYSPNRGGLRRDCRSCHTIKRQATRSSSGREAEYGLRREQLRLDPAEKERRRLARLRVSRRKAAYARIDKKHNDKKNDRRIAAIRARPWLAEDVPVEMRDRVRRQTDPSFVLRERMRNRLKRKGIKGEALKRIRAALKAVRPNRRRSNLEALLGYSIDDLRIHLEKQFTEGMSWESFGSGAIHIDHIKPLNTYDLMDADQSDEAWSMLNLRPLWAIDNLKRPKDGSDVAHLFIGGFANDNEYRNEVLAYPRGTRNVFLPLAPVGHAAGFLG